MPQVLFVAPMSYALVPPAFTRSLPSVAKKVGLL